MLHHRFDTTMPALQGKGKVPHAANLGTDFALVQDKILWLKTETCTGFFCDSKATIYSIFLN
jgi:hypothetical protein